MSNALLLRADGDAHIGTGHVMRCLALAQAWQDAGGKATFLMAVSTPTLVERVKSEEIEVLTLNAEPGSEEDARQTIQLAFSLQQTGQKPETGNLSHSSPNSGLRSHPSELAPQLRSQVSSLSPWVVADGYEFGAAFQRKVKDAGLQLLLVDDYGHAESYCADIVLNQNLYSTEDLYTNRESSAQLLLGSRYVLLRREFAKWRGWTRQIQKHARKVLVTLGGGDPNKVTGKVIRALWNLDVEVKIVVGGSNPHTEELRAEIRNLKNGELVVDAPHMPELMAWADVAVAAGGTTSCEMAFMGLPSIVFVLADNQQAVAAKLDAEGVSLSVGDHSDVSEADLTEALHTLLEDPARRQAMSRRGQELVDGLGGDRVVMNLRAGSLRLRQADENDCRLIWEWANDPQARAVSFSQELIPWEEHVQWFTTKLHSPSCYFYVATDSNGVPVGQIRYDLDGREAVVSVSLAPGARGKGTGSALIAAGSRAFFQASEANVIHAYIKPGNEPSVRAFLKAGYRSAPTAQVRGQEAQHFILRKN